MHALTGTFLHGGEGANAPPKKQSQLRESRPGPEVVDRMCLSRLRGLEEVSTHLDEGRAPRREPPAHRYMCDAPPLFVWVGGAADVCDACVTCGGRAVAPGEGCRPIRSGAQSS